MNRTPNLLYIQLLFGWLALPFLFPSTSYCNNYLLDKIPNIAVNQVFTDTICAGTCLLVGAEEFCETGTYTTIIPTADGLGDSTVIVALVVEPMIVSYQDYTICEGDCFRTGRKVWCEPGTYQYETYTQEGCSMIIVYNLIVRPHKETRINQIIGYDECIDFGSNTFCQTGEYELRYGTQYGCDSTVYINLTVEELIVNAFSQTLCAGECLSVADTTLCESGLYEFMLEDAAGRDSLVRVDLRIQEALLTRLEESICDGSAYEINGLALTTAGSYEYVFSAVNGCDSLVQLDLAVGEVTSTSVQRQLPLGECLAVGRNIICFEGQYDFVFHSTAGCDSIVIVDLSFENTTTTTTTTGTTNEEGGVGTTPTDSMPDMTEVPVVPMDTITPSGSVGGGMDTTQVSTTTSIDSCLGNIVRESLCFGEFYTLGNNTFWEGGRFNLKYDAPLTCNNNVILDLYIETDRTEVLEQTICEGNTYQIGDQFFNETGQYEVLLQADSGCDSLVTLDLIVGQNKDTTITETICYGDFYLLNNQLITTAGTYPNLYQTQHGCDSMVVIELIVDGSDPITDRIELCAGSCFEVGRNKACVSGRYNFIFQSATGCDSVATIDLVIPDTIRTEIRDTFCQDDSYAIDIFSVTKPGRYTARLTNAKGCDSLVYVNLATIDCEINAVQDADTVICGGNTGSFSFALVKGLLPFTYKWASEDRVHSAQGRIDSLHQELSFTNLPGGIYTVTVSDRLGKEAALEIEIIRPDEISTTWRMPEFRGLNFACADDANAFLEVFPEGGVPPFRYEWSNGARTPRIENLSSGDYTVTITDHYNCPHIDRRVLSEPPQLEMAVVSQNPACDDLISGYIDVATMAGGTVPYEFRLGGTNYSTQQQFEQLEAGTYTLIAKDANNCQVDTTIVLKEPKIIDLSYQDQYLIELGDEADLDIVASHPVASVTWSEGIEMTCTDCLNPPISPLVATDYAFTVTSEDDCTTTGFFNVQVSMERDVFVPNVFSPNSDGLNDRFAIFGGPEVERIDYFRVYSRWGTLVYEASNLQPNDLESGWDGSFKGQKMNTGVYVWMAQLTFIDKVVEDYSGDVLLKK